MSRLMSSTQVRFDEIRTLFEHLLEPGSFNGQEPKYSVCALADKGDKEIIKIMEEAIKSAEARSVEKFGGEFVKTKKRELLHDGDGEKVYQTVVMSGQAVKIKRRVKKNRKSIITVLSLVMSITVFAVLQSFTGLLDTSASLQDRYIGDFAVTNTTIGISEEVTDARQAKELVESLSTTKLPIYMSIDEENYDDSVPLRPLNKVSFATGLIVHSHETLQKASLDEAHFLSCVPDLSEQGKVDLLARMTGVADSPGMINNAGYTNGVQVIVADSVYNYIVVNNNFSEIYPILKESADAETLESWIDDWFADNPSTRWLSYSMSDAQREESFKQIQMLCRALIIFIDIIDVPNIINTVYRNSPRQKRCMLGQRLWHLAVSVVSAVRITNDTDMNVECRVDFCLIILDESTGEWRALDTVIDDYGFDAAPKRSLKHSESP